MIFSQKKWLCFFFKRSFILLLTLLFLPVLLFSNSRKSSSPKKPIPIHLRLECKFIPTIANRYLRHHINFNREDEGFENRVVEQFIKKMDPMKRYLTQKDVEKIKTFMSGILKTIKKNKDCRLVRKAYEVYKKRMEERIRFARKFLNSNFKLNREEELVLDPSARNYPKGTEELNEYYKKYIQFQLARAISSEERTEKEAKQYVLRQYERDLKNIHKMPNSKLWALFLDSYSGALDPHSGYLSVDDLEEFEIRMSLSLEGIGANLSYKDGFTIVAELVPGGAAMRSGLLKVKDKIIAVAQNEDGKFEDIIEMPLREVVKKIRGPKGTKVRLTILRKSSKKSTGLEKLNILLIRDKIKLEEEAISYHLIEKKIGPHKSNRKIALVRLDSFYSDPKKGGRSAFSDFKKLLLEIKKERIDALVLDLSLNRGGTLEDAVNIVGLFIKTGYVVKQSQRFPAPPIALFDKDSRVHYNGPLVILVDRVSASASEIVAGALQDYKRAVIVGADHTFGKGSVQSVEILPKGFGAIKTTVGIFFIPGGESTQRIGVASDIVLPSIFSEDAGEKTLDYALKPEKMEPFISQSAYVKRGKSAWNQINQNLIKRLRKKSKLRIQKDEDFKKILQTIEETKVKGKRIKISELFGEDKDKNKKMDQKEKENDQNVKSQQEKRKEAYLKRANIKEALHVALDLVAELKPNPQMTVQSAR